MRILLTGGSGNLGTEIQKLRDVIAPSSTELDITVPMQPNNSYDMVIHSAAYTNGGLAEINQRACFNVNVCGTFNLVQAFRCPFVFISTEYAFNGEGFYSRTKRMGEEIVKTHPNHLIIRTLFKPRPYPYATAYCDQWTQGDYVDVIAQLIVREIEKWDRTSKTVLVGTGRKLLIDLARQTKPDVQSISIHDIKHVKVPCDYQ